MGSKRKIASEILNVISQRHENISDFEEVHSFEHNSSLSATNNGKKTIEKIFWNGKGEINKHTLF